MISIFWEGCSKIIYVFSYDDAEMKTELLKYKPVSEKESPLNWNTVDQISKTIIKMELDHVQTYCFPNIVQISEKLP